MHILLFILASLLLIGAIEGRFPQEMSQHTMGTARPDFLIIMKQSSWPVLWQLDTS